MSDLSPAERLEKLRTLESWLAWQLQDTRRKITALEQAAARYIVEKQIREGHPLGATIHLADCTMPQRETRPLSAEDARAALTKDAQFFHACEFCAPDRSLGIAD
ncbi:DUF6233 domain-containing protein [Streptomyces sp. NPDC052043]|uniref:DUF6233 domain-containing protein n=1 Tax=Streptomyces sp. NPDC052043 TaxID=3365684 RepID=UPI0037D50D5A